MQDRCEVITIFSVILNLEDNPSSEYVTVVEPGVDFLESTFEHGGEFNILSVEPLVRCRECKHRPVKSPDKKGRLWITAPRIDNEDCLSAFVPTVGEFDLTCPYLCDDPYYNRMPDDNYYCSRGERKDYAVY